MRIEKLEEMDFETLDYENSDMIIDEPEEEESQMGFDFEEEDDDDEMLFNEPEFEDNEEEEDDYGDDFIVDVVEDFQIPGTDIILEKGDRFRVVTESGVSK